MPLFGGSSKIRRRKLDFWISKGIELQIRNFQSHFDVGVLRIAAKHVDGNLVSEI